MTTRRSLVAPSSRIPHPIMLLRTAHLVLALAVLCPAPVLALQAGGALGAQNLRPYAYLFVAYAVAWLLILGWVVLLGRRVGRLARRLDHGRDE